MPHAAGKHPQAILFLVIVLISMARTPGVEELDDPRIYSWGVARAFIDGVCALISSQLLVTFWSFSACTVVFRLYMDFGDRSVFYVATLNLNLLARPPLDSKLGMQKWRHKMKGPVDVSTDLVH